MNTLFSNIFVILYLAGTLRIRFMLEPQLQQRYLISILFGLFALLFLWALIRSKVIKPTILGLHRFSAQTKEK